MLVKDLSKDQVAAIFLQKYLYDIANINKMAAIARERIDLGDKDEDRSTLYFLQKRIYQIVSEVIAEGFVNTYLDPVFSLGDMFEAIDIAAKDTASQLSAEKATEKNIVTILGSLLVQVNGQITSQYQQEYYSRAKINQTLQTILDAKEDLGEEIADQFSDETYATILRRMYSLEQALGQVDDAMSIIGDPEELADQMIREFLPMQLKELGFDEEIIQLIDLTPFIEDGKAQMLPRFRAYFDAMEAVLKEDIMRIYS